MVSKKQNRDILAFTLLRFFLVAGVIFTSSQLIQSFINNSTFAVSLAMTIVFSSLLLLLYKKPESLNLAMLLMFGTSYVGTIVSYLRNGEMEGLGPFLFIAGFMVNIIFFRGVKLIVILSLIALASITVIYFRDYLPLESIAYENSRNINISFLIFMVFMASIIIYLKLSLFRSNVRIQKLNGELQEINEKLLAQSVELSSSHKAILDLNSNLESIVNSRADEVKLKNDELSEFAYVNAHILRAPLTRVMGLTYLITRENLKIKTIQSKAEETDQIIKRISNVLH